MRLPFTVVCCILGIRYGVPPQVVAEWPADWWSFAATVDGFLQPAGEQAPHTTSPRPPRME